MGFSFADGGWEQMGENNSFWEDEKATLVHLHFKFDKSRTTRTRNSGTWVSCRMYWNRCGSAKHSSAT